ncbi:ribosomal protein S18-alanine N-acetyltransferase [Paradevosia shaoguanensis]|uniref:Ribosomal protein S18-alanine N-acetyltransferase n=1 Tax=Paradevosia shaoguanensis TaxID=1335043 RepID=A0AA41QP68_9HYPH|nr:ribosomal protein S18-alanine N-acetyltransferase [Paradevosia shaoguanensis]MCF1743969.1 ribosomal protein S18-alanine N-acetyltransferase [Paradevosia shaoguanensis]MCI0128452.1 ribosomal protein S18-alanine N-acetyltransferase [Paradevosia shaoguanensis]
MIKLWMAPGGLHIEPGQIEDAEAMARLHAGGFYRGWPREDFSAYLIEANTPVLVACDAKRRMAGFAMLRLAGDEVELLTIVVDKKWRGKGVGAALLKAAFEDLMMSPARKMFLEVDAGNAAAIKLYRRHGFAEIGTRKGYYPRPDGSAATALVMARDLG